MAQLCDLISLLNYEPLWITQFLLQNGFGLEGRRLDQLSDNLHKVGGAYWQDVGNNITRQ
jgi:hypothetical protein